MTHRRYKILFLFLTFSLGASQAFAARAVISPDNHYTYVIECSSFNLAISAEIVVDYPSSLGVPQVIPGGMAQDSVMTVSEIPSMIRISLKPTDEVIPSGGILISLWFPQAAVGEPVPVGLSGTVVGVDGKRIAIEAWYQGPNDQPRPPEPDTEETRDVPAPPGGAGVTGGGTGGGGGQGNPLVNRAGTVKREKLSTESQNESKQAMTAAVNQDAPDGSDTNADLPSDQPFGGVLDRFRRYAGERTEAAMRCLFDGDTGTPFHQMPAVALSDGKSPVKVVFDLVHPGDQVKYLVMKNMTSVSFKYLNGGARVEVKALPQAGCYKASLLVKAEDRIFYFPLTVAPPLSPALAAGGVLDGRLVRQDYNRDSRIDYRDDYLLMANRLVLFH